MDYPANPASDAETKSNLPPAGTATTANGLSWTPAQRVIFRFLFGYFVLYIFFNPNEVFPGSGTLYDFYIRPFHRLIPWIGLHVLHLSKPITVFTNGSGDTTYDNVIYLFLAVLAAAACLIWTIVDRNRRSYRVLFYWLTTLVRYYLGITLLAYGYAKVFKSQFPSPGLARLLEPYGDSSPMGLAWTFLGYSYGYNLFMGMAEVVSGTLLLFRRTTAIGAFLALVVSANVMAINYSFDVPVKLLSTTMVLMALFLLGDNIRRLWGLFFLDRATRLNTVARPPIGKKYIRIPLVVLKYLLIAYILVGYGISFAQLRSLYGDLAPRAALYGIYNTRTFVVNNDTLPPLKTDSVRWDQLYIDGSIAYPFAGIKMMNDSTSRYRVKTDTVSHRLKITAFTDSLRGWQLSYRKPAPDSLILWGMQIRGQHTDSIRLTLIRYPLEKFRLVARGFNWVNEYPLNR